MKRTNVLAGLTLTALASSSLAYEAGDIILRAGVAHVALDASSSELSLNNSVIADSSANVHTNTQLGLTGVYMINENWGLELLASTPFGAVLPRYI